MILQIIDIETTGLDPERCQITEFACITWDSSKDQELGWFQSFISHPEYSFRNDPDWTDNLLENIKKSYTARDVRSFVDSFRDYLQTEYTLICAGKNFSSFDKRFLERIPGFPKIDYRSLDIGSLYTRRDDIRIPGLGECCGRAGVEYDPSMMHGAMYDAELCLKLLRKYYVEQK